jgi:acyl-CoA thioesterase I
LPTNKRLALVPLIAGLLAAASNCSTTDPEATPAPSAGGATGFLGRDAGAEAGTSPIPIADAASSGGAAGSESQDSAGTGGEGGSILSDGGASPLDDGILQLWTLGDSITVGVQGGFRNDIYNLLSDDGWTVDMVGTQYDESTEIDDRDHEGHVAFTFQNTLDEVDSWIDQIDTPDVVLMMLGTNDFDAWTNVPPPDHMADCMKLIDHVLEQLPSSKLIVATIPPQSSEIIESIQLDRSEMVQEFNGLLRQQLPAHELYEKRLFMADVESRITLDDLYDGIHPTREAHRKVAAAWYDALQPILPGVSN